MARTKLRDYLADPLLDEIYGVVKVADPVRLTQVDLTHRCNLRCQGCYFFAEGMDRYRSPEDEAVFDAFIEREAARGTNAMLITGGEPTLEMERLAKLYRRFRLTAVTNGLIKIPYEGFESMMFYVSVWGNHATDKRLRGLGKVDTFQKGLDNYRDDPRAVWYYTVSAGNAHEIPSVIQRIVENGNSVGFNFYGDISGRGGDLDHRGGFSACREHILDAIARWPERIWTTEYIMDVVFTRTMQGQRWGYENCCSLSVDHPENAERLRNGKPYVRHLNVYLPDLQTTRRCCTGDARDCDNCYETYTHMTWIINNMRAHLGSKEDFTRWLTTMYVYMLTGHVADPIAAARRLPAIHQRLADLRAAA
jgi:MoaA/NifB/PqqE/SkfB family radical SAM enzyme